MVKIIMLDQHGYKFPFILEVRESFTRAVFISHI